LNRAIVITGFALLSTVALLSPGHAVAQATPTPTPAPAARGAAAQAPRLTSFPVRPKAPQDVLDRGKGTFGVSCAFCHGSDAGGGEVGPNLKRSTVVLDDQHGELIEPIVHGGRQAQGMPRIELTNEQISDIADWLHSLPVTARTDPNAENINIVVGKAEPGKVVFDKTCASCHSVTGDLKAYSTKFDNPKALQQWWMMPGSGSRGGPLKAPPGLHLPSTTATVTMKDGKKIEGTLLRMDDYTARVQLADGTVRTIDRSSAKVDVHDPLQPHKDMLKKISDKDIHDVTAYLVTLK
jgi:cytochrome c oxidase cbb3-type subunit III